MTTTQGEHAQTEALDAAQTLEYWAKDLKGLLGSELLFAAAKLRSLHAQVAALTAERPVAPATIPRAYSGRERGAYEAGWDDGFDHGKRTAAPAQPAAPQGVAYAELPEPDSYLFQHDETGLTQFVDAQQVEWGFQQNNPRLRRIGGAYTADKMRDFADRTHALRASHGQAPAGAADDDEVDLPDAEDMAHSALQEALSFGLSHDVIYRWMRAIQDQTVKAMRTPTAQAEPAAGAVAGPGWKLVPVVVTNEMWQAYKRPSGKSGDWSFAQRYTAMIAAAPTPAAQADSVLEDAAWWISTAQAELDGVETDDANNCLKAARGALEKALAAARKQGGKHD